jgi:hypothetical protein
LTVFAWNYNKSSFSRIWARDKNNRKRGQVTYQAYFFNYYFTLSIKILFPRLKMRVRQKTVFKYISNNTWQFLTYFRPPPRIGHLLILACPPSPRISSIIWIGPNALSSFGSTLESLAEQKHEWNYILSQQRVYHFTGVVFVFCIYYYYIFYHPCDAMK